jgi:hypothetical protein
MPKLALFIIGWTSLCGILVLFFGIFSFFRLLRLGGYLKKNDYQTWRELTSIGNYGPGLSNPFRTITYLFRKSDVNDERLLRIKDAARISTRYFLIWFTTLAATIIIGTLILAIYYS